MMPAPYPSLVDFARSWGDAPSGQSPAFVLDPPPAPWPRAATDRVEEVVDTIVALQRAAWLQDGVYAGPRAMPEVWRATLDGARVLRVPVPPVIVAKVSHEAQGAWGTDGRAFLLLSSFFVSGAPEAEVRYAVARLLGHLAARQVTSRSIYAWIADHEGVRRLARQALGPLPDIVLGPLSLGVRLPLSGWHRQGELVADRAGLVACPDLAIARRCLMRWSLGVEPTVSPEDYLSSSGDDGPSRWVEWVSDRPFLPRRLRALELWSRSARFAAAVDRPVTEGALNDDELRRALSRL
jgi:hypothetical protein